MATIIHTADIHLDSPLRNLPAYEGAPVEAVRGAARRAFDALIEETLSRPADLLLISGDLYDGDWQDYNTGLYFASRMARLKEAGIPVCIIAGNHDAESRMTRTLRLPENVHLLPADRPGTVLLDKIGVAVHGQGFSAPAVRDNLASRYPDAMPGYLNIGMLHTCATGREGHEPYAPCTLDDLRARGYHYWALGHVHQREVLCEDPPVIFPGNLQGRHIRETGPKGCMILTTEGEGVTAVAFHRLDRIRWERVEADLRDAVGPFDAVDAACEETLRSLEENNGLPLAVRVVLSGRSPVHEPLLADPERWLNQLRLDLLDAAGGAVWVESMEIRTAPAAAAEILEEGPVGELLSLAEGVGSDPALMAEMAGVLADLLKKLPREVREALAWPGEVPHAWLGERTRSVRPMLLSRLLDRGRPR